MTVDNVTPIAAAVRDAVSAPDFTRGDGGGEDPRKLPPGAPITALGKDKLTLWLLDEAKQLLGLKPRELGKGELLAICGDSLWLVEQYPRWSKPTKDDPVPKVIGFDQALAQEAIVVACNAEGRFNPQGNLFGRGAHRREIDNALVLHLGNRVIVVGARHVSGRPKVEIEELSAGRIDGKVYPALDKLPPPAPQASSRDEAKRLLDLFGKWYFAEPGIAPLLLLGWVGHAMLCGAFGWRPHVWLTGETAAGKSTLQKLIRAILDRWGLYTEDASEAAVRQTLGLDTLPVLIDEAEADDRAERQQAMINLARKASSGGLILRGSADHNAQEFNAQSAFLFSSILHAPLDPQDRNRFAILAMRQVPEDAVEPMLDLKYWREAGRRMHRRMIEQWGRFDATLHDYKEGIRAAGFQGRWRDTFGTLLACADMLLHDCAPSQDSMANDSYGREVLWVQQCLPLMTRGALEAEDTTTRCIAHLTSSLLPAASGMHQETVGRWLQRAMDFDPDSQTFNKVARDKLKAHGLKVVNLTTTATGKRGAADATWATQVYVLVASKSNVALRDLFARSKWYDGGWSQALALAKFDDGAAGPVTAETGIAARFTGGKDYAVAVPLEAMIGKRGDW